MRARSRALNALPFTFTVYVIEALLATSFALPLGLELARQLRTSSWDASQSALSLESVFTLASGLRVSAGSGLLALALLALLSPWLQMSWFSALSELVTVRYALARGAGLIVRAWLVSLLLLLAALLLSAPLGFAGYLVHKAFLHATDAHARDRALLGALGPLLPLALFMHLAHDLARAHALELGAWASALRGLRAALRPTLSVRALLICALGYGMVGFAESVAAQAASVPFRFLLTVTALQSALLARTFLRSLWLAMALTCAQPEPEPGPDYWD